LFVASLTAYNGFIDRALSYREAYASNFLADKEFWTEWLSRGANSDLFEKALISCPHFELAIEYLKFASTLVDEDKLVSCI
jgi:hypothetical protein